MSRSVDIEILLVLLVEVLVLLLAPHLLFFLESSSPVCSFRSADLSLSDFPPPVDLLSMINIGNSRLDMNQTSDD